jgi:hypothetical protein
MNLAKESGVTTDTSGSEGRNVATPRRPESFPGTAQRAIRCRLSKLKVKAESTINLTNKPPTRSS